MNPGITITCLNRHSGLDPLSPKRKDASLSRGRMKVWTRNEGKKRGGSLVVSCPAVSRQ